MKNIIIGAGLAGCTVARLLADRNEEVIIYEAKDHIGGNLYDYYNDKGVLVHKYGPHIFHTSYDNVWNFVNRFAKFNNYINRVQVKVDNKLLKMPINLDSIETLFPKESKILIEEIKSKFKQQNAVTISELLNNLENDISKKCVQFIFDNVYANYTAKMWGTPISEIDPNIISRVKINLNREWNYFPNDKYQGLPIDGYTKMLEKMIDSENIKVVLDNDGLKHLSFKDNKILFDDEEVNLIYTGPLDALFNYQYGELEYRSLDIQLETLNQSSFQEVAVVNYPSHPTMTRITEYKKMTLQDNLDYTTISKEYPGQYNKTSEQFNIPYYPISDEQNAKLSKQYLDEAKKYSNLKLLGRLSQYKYFDMDDIIYECLNALSD